MKTIMDNRHTAKRSQTHETIEVACWKGIDQLVHRISTFRIERTNTSGTSLLSSLRRQNQQKVPNRKSFYTLGWGKWLSNPPRCQQPRRSKMHCLSTIREKMKFPRMHIALETPKGNKIKCGFIDALLSWLTSGNVLLKMRRHLSLRHRTLKIRKWLWFSLRSWGKKLKWVLGQTAP